MGSLVTNLVRNLVSGSKRYESPVDLSHKEEFTPEVFRKLLVDSGFVDIQVSFHDFLAYPFTGGFRKGLFSESVRIMKILLQCERWLERRKSLARARRLLSWRMLVRASKSVVSPPESPTRP
jgi:hypothetical protein